MVFCLVLRRSPRSPLFPYTTLFRSARSRRPGNDRGADAGGHGQRLAERRWGRTPHLRVENRRCALLLGGQLIRGGDRKSTRLNSSHLGISYAVFCLKKKKEITKSRL